MRSATKMIFMGIVRVAAKTKWLPSSNLVVFLLPGYSLSSKPETVPQSEAYRLPQDQICTAWDCWLLTARVPAPGLQHQIYDPPLNSLPNFITHSKVSFFSRLTQMSCGFMPKKFTFPTSLHLCVTPQGSESAAAGSSWSSERTALHFCSWIWHFVPECSPLRLCLLFIH